MKIGSIVIPFTVAAADVNTLDNDPVTIASVADIGIVRVPVCLELKRAAGTAYAVGRNSGYTRSDKVPVGLSYSDSFGGGEFLRVVDDHGHLLFQIPLDFLKNVNDGKLVALPLSHGVAFRDGTAEFSLYSTSPLSGGTGTLTGELHFDEYAI